MRRVVALVALAFIGSPSSGCSPGAGLCAHVYRDAVLHVSAVLDSASSADIDSVFITGVSVEGSSLPLYLAVLADGHETGVQLDGDTLRCSAPFSFGHSEGAWQVTLFARGYPLQTLTFNARYQTFRGGCPSYNDRGTTMVLRLSR